MATSQTANQNQKASMNNNVAIPQAPKPCYYNVLLVNAKCSPISYQVWSDDGDPTDAWASVQEEVDRGNDASDCFRVPVARAFIYCTATEESYEFTF